MLALGVWTGAAQAARIEATHRGALADRPVEIRVIGLKPGAKVRLEAVQPASPSGAWTGVRTFRADARGVAVAGAAGMSLFWDAIGSSATFPDLRKPAVLSARVGGKVVAATTLRRRTRSPGVARHDTSLAADGFVGSYFTPPKPTGKPAVLLLGGSDGGKPDFTAGLLSSHGFPTLSLAYFLEPGLPQYLVKIPLEYFRKALGWLGGRPGVDPAKVAVVGTSRGAEAALLIGATYPSLVHRVAALSPSSVVNGGLPATGGRVASWTLDGKPVPYVRYGDFGNPDPLDAQDAVIRVERIAGPIFLAAGGSDALWPSDGYAAAIQRRLQAHGRPTALLLDYPLAGHASCGVPYLPYEIVVKTRYGMLDLGGTRPANAAAQADCWPRLLRFLAGD